MDRIPYGLLLQRTETIIVVDGRTDGTEQAARGNQVTEHLRLEIETLARTMKGQASRGTPRPARSKLRQTESQSGF
jgi:hypothetical protein